MIRRALELTRCAWWWLRDRAVHLANLTIAWADARLLPILAVLGALCGIITSAIALDLSRVIAWAITLAWTVLFFLEERRANRLNARWSRDYIRMALDLRRTARTMYDVGVRDGRREAAGGAPADRLRAMIQTDTAARTGRDRP